MPLKFLLLAALVSLAAQPSSSRQQSAQQQPSTAATEKWERYTYAGEELSVEMQRA